MSLGLASDWEKLFVIGAEKMKKKKKGGRKKRSAQRVQLKLMLGHRYSLIVRLAQATLRDKVPDPEPSPSSPH